MLVKQNLAAECVGSNLCKQTKIKIIVNKTELVMPFEVLSVTMETYMLYNTSNSLIPRDIAILIHNKYNKVIIII